MTHPLRIALEAGPKGKRTVAWAPDWPGLERGAPTESAAIDRLLAYAPRYAPVAAHIGQSAALSAITDVDIVERYPGVGSTDFWGISFAMSAIDWQELSSEALERELALLTGCWAFFDTARARVSAELRKGPRGGGRERDAIVHHVVANERDWAKKLGLVAPEGGSLTDADIRDHRAAYLAAIRAFHAEGKPARTWPLRFLIRHTAFHTMDHAWEMEDRDLTAAPAYASGG